jgi:hypothetical protein
LLRERSKPQSEPFVKQAQPSTIENYFLMLDWLMCNLGGEKLSLWEAMISHLVFQAGSWL